jgi:hypothetical protein
MNDLPPAIGASAPRATVSPVKRIAANDWDELLFGLDYFCHG